VRLNPLPLPIFLLRFWAFLDQRKGGLKNAIKKKHEVARKKENPGQ
jgi:hypothetical protein